MNAGGERSAGARTLILRRRQREQERTLRWHSVAIRAAAELCARQEDYDQSARPLSPPYRPRSSPHPQCIAQACQSHAPTRQHGRPDNQRCVGPPARFPRRSYHNAIIGRRVFSSFSVFPLDVFRGVISQGKMLVRVISSFSRRPRCPIRTSSFVLPFYRIWYRVASRLT